MKVTKIKDYKGGWFIGNFEPSVLKTDLFEVCYKTHYKGEKWDTHYHKKASEVNYLIRGKMTINEIELNEGDVFVIEPYFVSEPVFLTNCELIVVKMPSQINDKYLVELNNKAL
jgi:mannose-6-phosphate isomerase-like protein (cupin superfamily)